MVVFSRLLLDGIAGIKFILELRPVHTLSIIKAHFSFYYYINKMRKKRNNLNQVKNYFQLKSIVWNYFVLKKQTYNELDLD